MTKEQLYDLGSVGQRATALHHSITTLALLRQTWDKRKAIITQKGTTNPEAVLEREFKAQHEATMADLHSLNSALCSLGFPVLDIDIDNLPEMDGDRL